MFGHTVETHTNAQKGSSLLLANLKRLIRHTPILGPALRRLKPKPRPILSTTYWEERYRQGGTSGPGSYGILAQYKADFLNRFVVEHAVHSVIEFGCGDGHQLSLAHYPTYTGYDVSPAALDLCRTRFAADRTKSFLPMPAYAGATADLTLSLDVIYHLLEDDAYAHYMTILFSTATRYVIIYSSNYATPHDPYSHVRHRRFTDWVTERCPTWGLQEHVPNPYPPHEDLTRGTFADFYVFAKLAATGRTPT
jgi:hypothetical protein